MGCFRNSFCCYVHVHAVALLFPTGRRPPHWRCCGAVDRIESYSNVDVDTDFSPPSLLAPGFTNCYFSPCLRLRLRTPGSAGSSGSHGLVNFYLSSLQYLPYARSRFSAGRMGLLNSTQIFGGKNVHPSSSQHPAPHLHIHIHIHIHHPPASFRYYRCT